MKASKTKIVDMTIAAMCLALALVLPFLTGQIKQIGNALCPMHFPVYLCGFFCGPWYGTAVGLIAPLLRFALFGAPALVPSGIAMCFELAAYGFVSGALYRILPKTKTNVYVSLIAAMIAGRIVWGIERMVLFNLDQASFGWNLFITGAFINALPGILIQLVLVPVLVFALKKRL